jgi:hypothetical protein
MKRTLSLLGPCMTLGLWMALGAGCAGTQPFDSSFASGGDRVGQSLARARASVTTASRPVIVGVADAPRSVFAYDLSGQRLLFRQNAQVVGLPWVAGELVAVPEADKVTLRRLRDGSVLHALPLDGMHLIGAAGDSSTSAVVLSTGGTMNVRSRLVMLRGEQVTSNRVIPRGLGIPAVLGGLAFVPHNRVHVSAIDAEGNELSRVRAQDDVASEAFTREGAVYFGQRGFYRLDADTERGAKNGAHYFRPALEHKLPGNPPLLTDTTEPAPAIESALYRVRLAFAPESVGDQVDLLDDSLYLAFYKQLFALTPDASAARWVHETASDVVGIGAVAGGLIAVESSGAVTALDDAGQVRFSGQLGLLPLAVRVRAERFDHGVASASDESLAQRLERAARNPDTRLVPSRAFAATLLGAVEDDQAARSLIALCGDAATPTRVREEACTTLSRRSVPSDAVLAALALRADFLVGTSPPPSGALAMAALHGGDKRTVPALLEQLNDPATPLEQLPGILRALGALGDASTAPALAGFVRLYHADTADEDFEGVLAIAMDALLKLDRERARAVLDTLSNDGFARIGVRTAAQRRLAELGPAPAGEDEPAQAQAEPTPVAAEPAAVDDGPPAHLTSRHVEDALSAVRPRLSRCVDAAPQHPFSARLVIVIDGDGNVAEVRALPESVQACVTPLVREVKFPATRYGRRSMMSYTIVR